MNGKFDGTRVKEIRRRKGLNQKELAALAGISNSYLSDIEVGRTNPSLKTLFKIAEALEVGIDAFMRKNLK
jgi:transcriptional regulator with XRE-family HTH domain